MAANNQLANQKLNQQQYNQFDRYSENFNRAQALSGASNTDWQNAFNGAGAMAGGLASLNNGNLGFGKTQGQQQLAPGTASNLQIPQSMWNSPGLGYQNQPNVPYGTNWKTF